MTRSSLCVLPPPSPRPPQRRRPRRRRPTPRVRQRPAVRRRSNAVTTIGAAHDAAAARARPRASTQARAHQVRAADTGGTERGSGELTTTTTTSVRSFQRGWWGGMWVGGLFMPTRGRTSVAIVVVGLRPWRGKNDYFRCYCSTLLRQSHTPCRIPDRHFQEPRHRYPSNQRQKHHQPPLQHRSCKD